MRNNIKRLVTARGGTVAERARQLQMQPHTLARYARGDSEPKMNLAEDIAEVLECSVEEVLGTDNVIEKTQMNRLPCYFTDVNNTYAEDQEPLEFLDLPSDLQTIKNVYAVKIAGDSMHPRFSSGDICIVHPYEPARIGDSVVLKKQSGNAVINSVVVNKSGSNNFISKHRIIRVIYR